MTWVDGANFLVRDSSPYKSLSDLAGKKIAVIPNTTTVGALKQALDKGYINPEIVLVHSHEEGLEGINKGTVDAYASDQTVLIGLAVVVSQSLKLRPRIVEGHQKHVELILANDGHRLGDVRDEFVEDLGADLRQTVRFQRVGTKFEMIAGIRRERIAGHADDPRVMDGVAGDAVPHDPTQVLANVVENIAHDADFVGQTPHDIRQSFGLLLAG